MAKKWAADEPRQRAQTETFNFFEADRLGRRLEEVRQLYRKVDPTMEYAESNYYKLRIAEQRLESMRQEDGGITVTCQFCSRVYSFDQGRLSELLAPRRH